MEETIDLREYFGIIKKRFWIIALITVIAAVVSGIFACEDIEEGTKELLQKVNMVVKNHA